MATEDDVEADIRAAISETMGGSAEPVQARSAAPEPELEADDEPTAAERARDEQGRFAKSEKQLIPEGEAREPASPTILPPRSWTAQAKAKFLSLDPDVQQEVLRREKEIEDGKREWDTRAERFNRWDATLAPVRDRLTIAGITEEQYLQALIRADEMLRGPNSTQAIQMLAQQYGINLAHPQQQFQPAYNPNQGLDPAIVQLQNTVQSLQQSLQQQDQAREEAKRQEAVSQIEAFANDPANIYFDNVKPLMGSLMESGQASDLKTAYDMACNASPEIRVLLQAKPKPAAKPAGLSVTGPGKPGQTHRPVSSGPNSDIQDDIRAAIAELSGAV